MGNYENYIGDIKVLIQKNKNGNYSFFLEEENKQHLITDKLKLTIHDTDDSIQEVLDESCIGFIQKFNENISIQDIQSKIVGIFMTNYKEKFNTKEIEQDIGIGQFEKNICFEPFYKKKEKGINKGNKVLLILQGVQGSGKSTWIKENNLEQFTLSTDDYRLKYTNLEMKLDGSFSISQESNKLVFQKLFEDLEERMKRGLFTIIDATHVNVKSINEYKKLLERYKYSFAIKRFDVVLDILIERNKNRSYRNVDEEVIRVFYELMKNLGYIEGVTYINDIKDLNNISTDLKKVKKYEKIFYIGDIQGCPKELQKFLDKYYNEKNLYIFTGDLLDRGYDDLGVLEIMSGIVENDNVILIKGNHDEHLERFYNQGMKGRTMSKTFDEITSGRIKNFSKEKLGKIIDKFVYSTFHEIGGKRIFACHGGIPRIENFISNFQLIRGVGEYEDHHICDQSFEKWSKEQKDSFYYLVHGHRNSKGVHVKSTSRTFNLEGKIEFGGELRAVSFDQKGVSEIITIESSTKKEDGDNKTMFERFQGNEYIRIKTLEDGIYSINFTQEAFFGKVWDSQTLKARGLFIGLNDEIYARSYEKFFNVGEREDTKKNVVGNTLGFPIDVYKKYNGFLGIVGMKDGVVKYFNKSSDSGKFPYLVRKHCSKYEEKLKHILKEGFTAVFEICDKSDSHIVEENERAILLDIVKNDITKFEKKSYEELKMIGKIIGCEVKEKVTTLNNDEELQKFFVDIENHKNEGYVIEGKNGMSKTKSKHYLFWKEIRGSIRILKKIINSEYLNGKFKYDDESQEFKDLLNKHFIESVNFDELTEFMKHKDLMKRFQEEKINIYSMNIVDLVKLTKDWNIKEEPIILNDSE